MAGVNDPDWVKFIIGIAYFAFFIFISGISLRYLANSIKLIYFEETPIIFLLMFFFFPTVIACKSGIKNIAQVNLMFMPLLLISMLIILFATVKDSTKNLSNFRIWCR